MSEEALTTDQALQELRSTPLPEGHVWYARSMTEYMDTLERKVFKTGAGVVRWLQRQAEGAGAPLEFAMIMYHPSPAFRFYAGDRSFRVIVEDDRRAPQPAAEATDEDHCHGC